MSYLSPINTRIEPILVAAKSAACLYNNDYDPVTSRKFQCRYCGFIRKIKELRELCDNCDRAALTSDTDHEYDCPFGLREAVIHLPLKNGMMHAIMGKRRPKTEELASERLQEAIARGVQLNYSQMMDAYREIPLSERDDFEEQRISLAGALQSLRDEGWLDSFENETILQAIGIMRKSASLRCADLIELLNWSESSLNRLFWKYCNERFCDFITERKMVFAEDRLTNSDDSIMQIADDLDYNYMYFQTLFKNHCSITPLEFRRNGFRGHHPPRLPF